MNEPEHILDKSCWCNPTVIPVGAPASASHNEPTATTDFTVSKFTPSQGEVWLEGYRFGLLDMVEWFEGRLFHINDGERVVTESQVRDARDEAVRRGAA